MDFLAAVNYLNSFINYERTPAYSYGYSFKLERISNFLNSIGNPQNSLKTIHVAGTKGKGSTASFIAYILRAAGFRAGLYSSPHLNDFKERIRILEPEDSSLEDFEGRISQEDFSRILAWLKPQIEIFNKENNFGPLTFFEIITSLALVYFKERKTDFVVLETGLGGRLDATNVCNSLVQVLTPISIEHVQYLGSTLSEIASEKAGIIKKNSLVVSAPQKQDVEKVFREKAQALNSKIYFLGKDFLVKDINSNFQEQCFSLRVRNQEYKDLKINLKGNFQINNACLALAAIDLLRDYEISVSRDAIKTGLEQAKWPGRFEVVSDSPITILDGAQNTHSIGVLMDTVKKLFPAKKIISVLGACSDKDILGMAEIIENAVDTVILTRADNPRASLAETLEKSGGFKDAVLTDSVIEAIDLAKNMANRDDVILVTGSLFVVAEAREYLKKYRPYAIVK